MPNWETIQRYNITRFRGLDESVDENQLDAGATASCMNMDTKDGNLAVGMGFRKIGLGKVNDTAIRAFYHWHSFAADCWVVATSTLLAAWKSSTEQWVAIYAYSPEVSSKDWDFKEVRIGTKSYLLIANGESEVVKWDGTVAVGAGEKFGSGEWVYSGTVSSMTYSATKATAVSYAEAADIGTWTLTMPAGWSYSAGALVAFTVPSIMNVSSGAKVVIGGTTYTMEWLPIWTAGDVAVVKLTSSSKCEKSDTVYGVNTITLDTAIDSTWVTRCENIGLRVNDYTYAVKSIDNTRKVVTFEEPITRAVATSDPCKIRGGVSDIKVNYLEVYYSRLFAAGDTTNPSRLYWSQPPSDIRSIEDWSMDDASDSTSGGFVDIGETNSDPIIGLCALSNQLLIFKRTSMYRMLGDRPSNFRVMLITREIEMTANSSIITDGDTPYWITNNGMYLHDGQTPRLIPNSRQIQKTLDAADISLCQSAKNRDRLYFTCKLNSADMLIVYDIIDRAYMLRSGFECIDITADNGKLYMLCPDGYIYLWDENCRKYGMESDYTGGTLIEAYWNTPFTDLGVKSQSKKLTSMFYRGEGGTMRIDSKVGKFVTHKAYQMPADTGDIVKIKLENEGRAFGFKLYNEYGSWFRILGGIEVRFENKEDSF